MSENFEGRTAVIIDLEKLAANIYHIKETVGTATKLMAVVKADAYGHGAVPVARVMVRHGVDSLGVATVEEGAELRSSGITVPILLLGSVTVSEMTTALQNDLELTVFDDQTAAQLSALCVQMDQTAKIHIKIDTGMGRIGFLPNEEGLDAISAIHVLPRLSIAGAYTHLAESDGKDKTFARAQFEKFLSFVTKIEARGVALPVKHVSNSGAVLDLRSFHMDMVRVGIIAYGLRPSPDVNFNKLSLQPILQWKSCLSYVKRLEKGQSVGYGRTFFCERETVVGTVPIGYADGFARCFSNRGHVLVNGQRAPVIGRVCMDQFMIDLTDIEAAKIGDEVVLIGRQGGLEISADEMAALRDTINYEVVCTIGKRVRRVYLPNE